MVENESKATASPSLEEARAWIGFRVDDLYGLSIGRLEDVWADRRSGAPAWLLVRAGRFGGQRVLVPFTDSTAGPGYVWVPYERAVIRNSPRIDPEGALSAETETGLRAHYADSRRG